MVRIVCVVCFLYVLFFFILSCLFFIFNLSRLSLFQFSSNYIFTFYRHTFLITCLQNTWVCKVCRIISHFAVLLYLYTIHANIRIFYKFTNSLSCPKLIHYKSPLLSCVIFSSTNEMTTTTKSTGLSHWPLLPLSLSLILSFPDSSSSLWAHFPLLHILPNPAENCTIVTSTTHMHPIKPETLASTRNTWLVPSSTLAALLPLHWLSSHLYLAHHSLLPSASLLFYILLLYPLCVYVHCISLAIDSTADGPCMVNVNILIRSISKISDLDMVSHSFVDKTDTLLDNILLSSLYLALQIIWKRVLLIVVEGKTIY